MIGLWSTIFLQEQADLLDCCCGSDTKYLFVRTLWIFIKREKSQSQTSRLYVFMGSASFLSCSESPEHDHYPFPIKRWTHLCHSAKLIVKRPSVVFANHCQFGGSSGCIQMNTLWPVHVARLLRQQCCVLHRATSQHHITSFSTGTSAVASGHTMTSHREWVIKGAGSHSGAEKWRHFSSITDEPV